MSPAAGCDQGTCPPVLRKIAQKLDMSIPATCDHRACPPLPRASGHTPFVPIPGPEDWTCPPQPDVTTGHVLPRPHDWLKTGHAPQRQLAQTNSAKPGL